jgi:hypothetical protein
VCRDRWHAVQSSQGGAAGDDRAGPTRRRAGPDVAVWYSTAPFEPVPARTPNRNSL